MAQTLSPLSSGPVKCRGFVDVGLLLAGGIDLLTIIANLQHAVDKAVDSGGENGLSFIPSKTEVVIFTHK